MVVKLLLVESDKHAGRAALDMFRRSGFEVDWAADAPGAMSLAAAGDHGFVVLEESAARSDLLEALSTPALGTVPKEIFVLSQGTVVARHSVKHDLGEGVRRWRFDLIKAVARLEVLLARLAVRPVPTPASCQQSLVLDAEGLTVTVGPNTVALSIREFRLLAALTSRPAALVSRDALKLALYRWGESVGPTAIEAHIASLRKKLGVDAIENVRGVGFRLIADEVSASLMARVEVPAPHPEKRNGTRQVDHNDSADCRADSGVADGGVDAESSHGQPFKLPRGFHLSTWLVSLLMVTVLVAACGGDDGRDEGALMRPGEDCLGCHAPGGTAAEAAFSVAGTVYPAASSDANAGIAGVEVVVRDANDLEVRMTSNAAGNFFTREVLSRPLKSVYVVRAGNRVDMSQAPSGACSACHDLPPRAGAPGRVYAP